MYYYIISTNPCYLYVFFAVLYLLRHCVFVFSKGVFSLRLTSIGAGNMATAILQSVIRTGRVKADDITIYDINTDKYAAFEKLGVHCAASVQDACSASEMILLAVKPQDYETVLTGIRDTVAGTKKVFISIAAAISTSYICTTLSGDFPVVRVMPNTPLLIGCGATAISRNAFVDDRLYTKICGLFAASGSVVSLPEEQMNAVISVNSSSPAYVYLFAKAMIDNAVEQGIDRNVAKDLVFQTLKGSTEMLIHSDHDPDELIRMVTSPKGTTEAALKSFDSDHFCDIVSNAMNACTARAIEISR